LQQADKELMPCGKLPVLINELVLIREEQKTRNKNYGQKRSQQQETKEKQRRLQQDVKPRKRDKT
jgi:hypothetical protein